MRKRQQSESKDAEQSSRGANGCDARRRKVAAEDEAEDTGTEVDQKKAERADFALHVTAQRHLKQHVEANMDDAGMQEDGHDEAEPLVGLRRVGEGAANMGIGDASEAAEVGERAFGDGAGGVGARPQDPLVAVLDAVLVPHARHVTSAHVDENIRTGTDHGVEAGMHLDGRTGEDGYTVSSAPVFGCGGHLQLRMISPMKTANCTVVSPYTTHGIFPLKNPRPLRRRRRSSGGASR